MSSRLIQARVDFHGVGQGLFSSGYLGDNSHPDRFRWIYDCGTTSKRRYLTQAIGKVASESRRPAATRPRLDLVFISHFDQDHINGLTALLAMFTVGTLVLPYMPMAQRLAVAFAEHIDTQQELIEFFVDPVAYIARREGVDVEHIVLVPSSGGEGPAGDLGEVSPQPPESELGWNLLVDRAPPDGADQADDLAMFRTSAPASAQSITFLRRGGRIRANYVWEFIPYNDPDVAPHPTHQFLRLVIARRSALLSSAAEPARAAALAAIRDAYDLHFGSSATERNEISLFVYAGATGIGSMPLDSWMQQSSSGSRAPLWNAHCIHRHKDDPNPGVLYTGDGYLDSKPRLMRLTKFLGAVRLGRIRCLQVMHHGAEANWHRGVAAALSPCASVFSSDPDHRRLGHPHAEVVRDFLPFGPVQVAVGRDFSCAFHWRLS